MHISAHMYTHFHIFFSKIFYCYSITVVCMFSLSLRPTPAKPFPYFLNPGKSEGTQYLCSMRFSVTCLFYAETYFEMAPALFLVSQYSIAQISYNLFSYFFIVEHLFFPSRLTFRYHDHNTAININILAHIFMTLK